MAPLTKRTSRRNLIVSSELDRSISNRSPRSAIEKKKEYLAKQKIGPRIRNKKMQVFKPIFAQEKSMLLYEIRTLEKKAWDKADKSMSPLAKEIIKNEMKNGTRHPKSRSYSERIKEFSLGQSFCSNRGYENLRSAFSLPTQRTLINYVSKVGCLPGHLLNVLLQVQEDIQKKKIGRRCTLVMDAFSVRKAIGYDPGIKGFTGLTTPIAEFKNGVKQTDPPSIATSCLVFLLVGLDGKWKRIVGYWFVSKESASKMTTIIKEALTHAHQHGIYVCALVCDGLAANIKAVEDLGAVIELENMKNFFEHPVTGKE